MMVEIEKHSPKWLLNEIRNAESDAHALFKIIEFQKALTDVVKSLPTDRAIDQAAFESEYGYSSTNYNSFKEGVKWLEGQLTECRKQLKTKER
jgi:hypothetical protein